MERIKLAYVTHGLSSNGIESFLLSVARRIDTQKYDVTFVIALDHGVPTLHGAEIESLGMHIRYVCDLDSLKKKAHYFSELKRIFRHEKFDIVHANMDLLNGVVLSAAKHAGVPKRICHSHTTGSQYVLNNPGKIKKTVQKLYYSLMKFLILHSSTVLLGCSEIANQYMYGKSADKATVIHNGIDLEPFILASKAVQNTHGVRKASVTFATVGRISPPKNPIFILSVLEQLKKLRSDFVLNWAGTGEMLDVVKEEILKRGLQDHVNLLGVRTDIPSVLSCCDYFLFPSLFEGLGIVLIEAQAAGLECFVSNAVPSLANVGLCRYLSLDDDAGSWAEEIDRVIRSKEKLKIDEALLQKFTVENTIRELDEVYQS